MKYVFLILISMSININLVKAGSGCCSWHGGQDYCDTTSGKWVCKDGTYSPSCKCKKNNIKNSIKTTNSDNKSKNKDSNVLYLLGGGWLIYYFTKRNKETKF